MGSTSSMSGPSDLVGTTAQSTTRQQRPVRRRPSQSRVPFPAPTLRPSSFAAFLAAATPTLLGVVWSKAALWSRLAKVLSGPSRRLAYRQKVRLISWVVESDARRLRITDLTLATRAILGLAYDGGPKLHVPLKHLSFAARRLALAKLPSLTWSFPGMPTGNAPEGPWSAESVRPGAGTSQAGSWRRCG